MTCLHYKTLIDDYTDNELDHEQIQIFEQHLKTCATCKQELDATNKLKELLQNNSLSIPSEFYFNETSELIFARTIEKNISEDNQFKNRNKIIKSEFIRALLSAVAAITLLATSILIGANDNMIVQNNRLESPVFVTTPIEQMMHQENSPIFTKAEQLNHIQGLLLISPPGMLGRLTVIHEYNRLSH